MPSPVQEPLIALGNSIKPTVHEVTLVQLAVKHADCPVLWFSPALWFSSQRETRGLMPAISHP